MEDLENVVSNDFTSIVVSIVEVIDIYLHNPMQIAVSHLLTICHSLSWHHYMTLA